MQTLSQFERSQADSKYLSIDVVTSKAEQSSWLVLIVAMICMVSIRFGELAATHGALVFLKLQQITDQLFGKSGAKKPTVIVHALLKIWIGLVALVHPISSTLLRVSRGRVLLPLRDGLWRSIKPRASFLNVWPFLVLGPALVAFLYGLWSHGGVALLFADPLAILSIEVALIFAVFRPLLGRAFTLFHGDDFIASSNITVSNCP